MSMLRDQARQGRAMVAIELLLDLARGIPFHAQMARHECGHAGVDLGEDAVVGAIQRIVEIENPVSHMAEIGAGSDSAGKDIAVRLEGVTWLMGEP